MERKTEKRSKSGAILVLVIVAVLTVIAFMYLSMSKSERLEDQETEESIETQVPADKEISVERLDDEDIYTQAPTTEPDTHDQKSTSNPEIIEQDDIPAATSNDPIQEGQLE